MKKLAALSILLALVTLARADQTTETVQQALKDQGFYYGEINGQKDTDTTAAIRRYQIRNGLQITGELNDETLRSIKTNKPASPAPIAAVTPATAVTPVPETDTSDLRAGPAPEEDSAPVEPPVTAPPDRQLPPRVAQAPVRVPGDLLAGTPYEGASADVQRSVVIFAQRALTRRSLFHDEINGVFGPNLEFSLRAYQSRVGLAVSGRLDLSTLAALELLPGANDPVYTPRRRVWRGRPVQEPPVRGEWIHD
jgi:peptidoglycan hydrolase-like protein with peptidoglycan-binding domain